MRHGEAGVGRIGRGGRDQIRRFRAGRFQAFRLHLRDVEFGLVLGALGHQFGHLDFGEELTGLHLVTFVHRDGFQIPGNFGVKRHLLIRAECAWERNEAMDFTALRRRDLYLSRRRCGRGCGSGSGGRSVLCEAGEPGG